MLRGTRAYRDLGSSCTYNGQALLSSSRGARIYNVLCVYATTRFGERITYTCGASGVTMLFARRYRYARLFDLFGERFLYYGKSYLRGLFVRGVLGLGGFLYHRDLGIDGIGARMVI